MPSEELLAPLQTLFCVKQGNGCASEQQAHQVAAVKFFSEDEQLENGAGDDDAQIVDGHDCTLIEIDLVIGFEKEIQRTEVDDSQ